MTSTNNPTAGIGDPYWYEWSVGLTYVVDMLNPDSGIEFVTLQSTEAQGLDDVVVSYSDGVKECIQIKHTRIEDTLTFGDMISKEEDKKSLLQSIAGAWKESKRKWGEVTPVLFTNRISGERTSTAKSQNGLNYTRPVLHKFWDHIQAQASISVKFSDIIIPEDWTIAWEEWLGQMDVLDNEEEKLEFIKLLRIEMEQPGLTELTRELLQKISNTFAITIDQAQSLLSLLDNSLREWGTTLRGTREAITRERVYTALSLPSFGTIGEHNLVPEEPFFPSRKQFVETLADKLLNGEEPIIFLSGIPGIGKTTVVSALANRRDPVIDLRYHAFRPITPQTTVLPTDAGETTKAEVLWSDLLSQLRTIFKGRLAHFHVPVRNDFLTTEKLRDHVLRLANELGKERGRPTVIAIDGIDHAARAGVDNYTFLETLIPPEHVPSHVRFLIVGQQAEAYDKYPFWIKDGTENVSHMTVEGMKDEDIESLFSSTATLFPVEEREAAVRLIGSIAQGNTLAAIFAIHEATYSTNIAELEGRLENRRLTHGLFTYYDQIWSAALQPLQRAFPFLGFRIAACLSLINERITGFDLNRILPEMNISASIWTDILRALRPLLIEEELGFRVAHNDVRVQLTKQVANQPKKIMEIASSMADYYMDETTKGIARHNDLFNLLRLSGRHVDQARVFTPQYVMEGYALNRPLSEMIEQCKNALISVTETKEWTCVHKLVCAATTLNQLFKTVDWTGNTIEFLSDIPPVLFSEGRVPNKESWTLDTIDNTLNDALRLVNSGQLHRARGLMSRWFNHFSPSNLIELLSSDKIYDDWYDEKRLSDRTATMLRTWGSVSQHTGIIWGFKDDGASDELLPLFFGGYLSEALKNGEIYSWLRALRRSETFYWDDLEICLDELVVNRRWVEVSMTLLKLGDDREDCPISFQIKAATYALLSGRFELNEIWVQPIADAGFDLLIDFDDRYTDKYAMLFSMISFVISWIYPHRENGGISSEGTSFYFRNGGDTRQREHLAVLLNASALVGKWFGVLSRKGPEAAAKIVTVDELGWVLNALVSQKKPWKTIRGYGKLTKNILEIFIFCTDRIGLSFEKSFFKFIQEKSSEYPANYMLEVGWNYLSIRGEEKLLKSWFDYWCGPNGKAWHEDIASRVDIVNRFIQAATASNFEDKVTSANKLLKWGMIGYTGHKEYVLENPLAWYQSLLKVNPGLWKTEGKRLLELSQEASKTGDNRISSIIEAAVSESVALSGVSDMWIFYNLQNRDTLLLEEPGTVFDGLIAMLETKSLSENELLGLWGFGLGVFMWQVGEDRGYLHDLRVAILHAAEREGIDSFSDKMEDLGKTEI